MSTCLDCEIPMVSNKRARKMRIAGEWDPKRVRAHHGHGLCANCHQRARRGPTRVQMSRAAVIEEVSFIVDGGNSSPASIALRLGLSRDAMMLALRRAARDGDTQAEALRQRLGARKVAA